MTETLRNRAYRIVGGKTAIWIEPKSRKKNKSLLQQGFSTAGGFFIENERTDYEKSLVDYSIVQVKTLSPIFKSKSIR